MVRSRLSVPEGRDHKARDEAKVLQVARYERFVPRKRRCCNQSVRRAETAGQHMPFHQMDCIRADSFIERDYFSKGCRDKLLELLKLLLVPAAVQYFEV